QLSSTLLAFFALAALNVVERLKSTRNVEACVGVDVLALVTNAASVAVLIRIAVSVVACSRLDVAARVAFTARTARRYAAAILIRTDGARRQLQGVRFIAVPLCRVALFGRLVTRIVDCT